MTAPCTPPFAYFGGKTLLAPRIAELLPPHEHYVEPFAGGLSVLLAKRPSVMETVNDLDGWLMTFWRVLRDRLPELERACALTPHSRGEYQSCQDITADPLDDEIETARRVWVRISQGRSGTQRRTGWRTYQAPGGCSMGLPGYLEAYVGRMAPAAERLARVSLENRPALEVLKAYGRVPRGVLLYVDPPYLGSTRSGRNYLVEMSSEAEHLELCAALRAVRAHVLLSGYDSELYAEELKGWHRTAWSTAARLASWAGNAGGLTEVLWSNRPLGEQPGLWGAAQ